MPKYTVMSNKDHFASKSFSNLNDATDFAANHFAKSCGLPKGKYYLQWDIVLRDDTYTRVYMSKEGLYTVVAQEIG